jgi:dihydrofolate synthase/folylpolyglutamate synthase
MLPSDAYLARFLALHPKLIDLSLDRIARLLARLGHPERRLPPVIHVAGTNGKGSTLAFLRAILEASGARVHTYTSPHLVRFHERIRLGGRLVDDNTLVAALDRAETANAGDPITFFEITTAAAFELFAADPADFLLLEVGLGGRFDTTNVVAHPLATIITPVSMDHREFLGDDVATIAGEKAGILKRGTPAILAEMDPAALEICRRQAARLGIRPLVAGEDFHAHEEGGRLLFQSERVMLDLPLPRLLGRHQFGNAAMAIATLLAVAPERATQAAIERGMLTVEWPARFQRLTGRLAARAPAGAELWLDGGHNADGARVLAETVAALEERAPKPLVLIAATMARKDAEAMLRPFLGLAQEMLAVPVEQEAARPPGELAALARRLGLPAVEAGSVEAALHYLAARAWPAPPRILIMGSLYLAGEVLTADGWVPS